MVTVFALVDDPAKACAYRVNHDQISNREQSVRVVDHWVGRRAGSVRIAGYHHSFGTKHPHVQPNRRGARSAIESEDHGARGLGGVRFREVREAKELRLGRAGLVVQMNRLGDACVLQFTPLELN